MKKYTLSIFTALLLAQVAEARVADNKFGAFEFGAGVGSLIASVDDKRSFGSTRAAISGRAVNLSLYLFAGYDFYMTDKWSIAATYHSDTSVLPHEADGGGAQVQFKDVSGISLVLKYLANNGTAWYFGPLMAKGTVEYSFLSGLFKEEKKHSGTALMLGMQKYIGKHMFYESRTTVGASKVPTSISLSIGMGF